MKKSTLFCLLGLVLALFSHIAGAEEPQNRLVDMDGAYNVRDLGGYAAAEGKTVRMGLVYRSGDLSTLTDRDVAELAKRGIRTVVDFRTDGEREAQPHILPETVTSVILRPIEFGNMPDLSKVTEADAEAMMRQVNRELVTQARPQYTALFKALADADKTPLLFNCSAGKDRTGLAAALFLSALGVDREVMYQDYLLSAVYLKDKYRHMVDKNPGLAPVFTVRRDYLEAAFAEIDTRYGGIENYLRDQIGVDLERMRQLYTE